MPDQNEVMNDLIRTAAGRPPAPIKVYVRLGDDENERTIAFRIPTGMDPLMLLERGATIDGNQAILPVAWDDDTGKFQSGGAYSCPDLNDGVPFEGKSLTRVLGDCQRGLVKFFKEQGHTVTFA